MTNNKERIKVTDNRWRQLFVECGGYCSICGDSLVGHKNGKYINLAEAAHIYPHSITAAQKESLKGIIPPANIEAVDNLIFLCSNCHVYQDNETTYEDYCKLKELKDRQMHKLNVDKTVRTVNIDKEINFVIEKLDSMDAADLKGGLSMEPVAVAKKVVNNRLKWKIETYVSKDFHYIGKLLAILDEKKSGRYNAIAAQVRDAYCQAALENTEPNIVFNALVEWLMSKTHGSREACESIISFFVQDCEVFDEISE